SPSWLMKPGPLATETPRRAKLRAFTNQSLCIHVTVVIEHNKICRTRRLTRLRYFDRCVSNLTRLPLPIRIVATQVSHFEGAITLRLDLIEQFDLIRRRTVCQYKNLHCAFACRNLINKCVIPTHASTT